jgi:hypothetical protein
MNLDKKLLQEINRFRMMSSYQPGKILNEQKFGIIKEETYTGIYEIIWSETGGNGNDFQSLSSKRGGYLNEIIGTIEDDVLKLNDIGNFIFDKRGYSKTIEQVELLEKQGRLRISNPISANYSKMSNEDGKNIKVKETKADVTTKRDVRRSKKMYKMILQKAIESASWNRSNSGSMIIQSKYPAAQNCGPENGFLWVGTNYVFDVEKPKGPEYKPVYTGDTSTGMTVDNFNIGEVARVFPDNIVNPVLVGPAKEEFDKIVRQFVTYINGGGFDKLKNVTIQGRADSANPTWDLPKGYSSLDHSYGGMKRKSSYTDDELDTMNLYLATQRAKNYKQKLIDAIKEKTGKDLTITELPAISYRGEEDKRGSKWRSILLRANAPEHKPVFIDPVKEKEYQDYLKTKEEVNALLSSGLYPVSVEVGTPDGEITINKDDNGVPYALSRVQISTQATYTKKGIYLSQDAIDLYKIPDEPNRVISNVQINDTGNELTLVDQNGNTQKFNMVGFSQADYEDNAVSLEHRKGGGGFTSYMGASDFNRGAGGTNACPDDYGKYATDRPMTTVDASGDIVMYGDKPYFLITNYWFAYTYGECAFSPPPVDYYSVETIADVFK